MYLGISVSAPDLAIVAAPSETQRKCPAGGKTPVQTIINHGIVCRESLCCNAEDRS
jgi:hypothetical protein